MAFNPDHLAVAVDTIGGGNIRIHGYDAGGDSETLFFGDGYFTEAARRGIRVNDLIVVRRDSSLPTMGYVSSINAAGNATLAIETLTGSSLNNITTVVSTTRSITNADRGKTIELAGSNIFYAATFAATTTLDDDFQCVIQNNDSWGSGRGKRIGSTSGDFTPFILYPGQNCEIRKIGTVLRRFSHFERARLPGGVKVFRLNSSTGDDDLNDGLGTDAPFKTAAGGYYAIMNRFDYQSLTQSTVELSMGTNETTTSGLHAAAHAVAPGAQGGAAIKLNGNGAQLIGSGVIPIELYHGCILQIENLRLSSTVNGALTVNRKAYLYMLGGIVFEGIQAVGGDILVTDGGHLEMDANYQISGTNGRAYHMINRGGIIRAGSITADLIANQNVINWVVASDPGVTQLNGITWTNPTVIASTNRANISANHVLYKSASFDSIPAGAVTSIGGQII